MTPPTGERPEWAAPGLFFTCSCGDAYMTTDAGWFGPIRGDDPGPEARLLTHEAMTQLRCYTGLFPANDHESDYARAVRPLWDALAHVS